MTAARFREILAALDMSQRGLARMINCREGTVRYWARGDGRVPAEVADWLERLMLAAPSLAFYREQAARIMAQYPPPDFAHIA